MENKKSVKNTLKSLFYILYFLILTAERAVSMACSFSDGAAFANPLESYMTVLVIASAAAGWFWLIARGKAVFNIAAPKSPSDFVQPTAAAGVLLLGGMVHTYGTVAPIQFASYGFLLLAMALHTWDCVKEKGRGLQRWLTFAYITAFSMAIPVVYQSECELKGVFIPLEIFTSIALVILFTVMAVRFFKKDSLSSFCPWVFLGAAVLDGLVVGLRWSEEINFFVLIFASVTVVLGIAGKIVSGNKKGI